jgi:hypothetical protein
MGIDIRLPLGLLFLLLGLILVIYGLVADPALYQQSLGINVNLHWGYVLLGFGAVMFALSQCGARAGTKAAGTGQSSDSSGH